MAHFNLETEIDNILRLNVPITRGPVARYQRKALEVSTQNASLSMTSNSFSKTPNKSMTSSKTPQKTPKEKARKNSTPGRKTPKTPGGTAGDRFIPNRATTQFEIGYYKVTQNKENNEDLSPNSKEFQKAMSENLNGGDINNARIIHYTNKAPVAPEGYLNDLRVVYSTSKATGSVRKSARFIPQVPERILDAPEIVDDYYLNLLDWSSTNQIAVGLGGTVYLWNASTGGIKQLMSLENLEYISSLSWIKEGSHLAVGNSTGEVQLWDVDQAKRLRNMTGHTTRVGSLSWNSYVVTSGSRSGQIHHHDVRVPSHNVGILTAHNQEVCGLQWSPDGRYLASGGNDNILCVWAAAMHERFTETVPLYSFNQHQAAVKAVGWCPWQSHVLASGGGTADRHVRFWNINTGVCVESVDTKSQICSILWSMEHKEFITGHGFANNQLIIWKYPSLDKVAELTGHSSRVLNMAMSPDHTTVASAAADETLRLWKCFAIDPSKKKEMSRSTKEVKSLLKQSIR